MKKRTQVHAEQHVAAPVETVWRLATDVRDWPRWCDFYKATTIETPGANGPGSAGEIRSLQWSRGTTREEVLEATAPTHFAYRLLSGLPLVDYRADVNLEPAAGGTLITWHSTFLNKFPGSGAINAFMLRRFLKRLLRDLKAEAESASRAPVAAGAGSTPQGT